MRHWIIAVFFIAGLRIGMAQNPFEPETDLHCIERFQVPDYPLIARQARIEETVTASVFLSSRASVELVTTELASKTSTVSGILIHAVEDAIREATIRRDCDGKKLVLIFDFKITGQASDSPKQTVSFGYPNKFWITTEPAKPVAERNKAK